MCFFSMGPWNTISRSSGVNSQNGTSVRTPIAPHTCFMRSHISVPHGSTAPSSMESDSSGTSDDSSTVRTMPVPPQVAQAPPLLKARSSAPGPKNCAPHTGQTRGSSNATLGEGGTRWPLGHAWLPTRENSSRR